MFIIISLPLFEQCCMDDGYFKHSLTFFGAAERAGTYRITVSKAGYQTWTRTGVQVTADVCHVHPAQAEARLQPAH